MDYILCLDTDEIIVLEEQKELLQFAQDNPDVDCFTVNINTYFGDLNHVAVYDQGHTPITLVRPHVRFTVTRCVDRPYVCCESVTMHHLKFLQPKDDILWRVGAKHLTQQRELSGSLLVNKNDKLLSFLSSCGYSNLKSDLTLESA
jgi:hypothetical protein